MTTAKELREIARTNYPNLELFEVAILGYEQRFLDTGKKAGYDKCVPNDALTPTFARLDMAH